MTSFITSPIYYVNDVAHIGHAYTTILCDMFKKYQYLKGRECVFLTGTDEHGQKIENAAKAQGKDTQEYADSISYTFRNLWNNFNISYDIFVRTTDDYHDVGVKNAFETMLENGDIYKGQYEGNYCVSCETFFTKRQLVDDLFCPDCGKETSPLKEESYFFRLSKYEKRLLEWYAKEPDVIMPAHKKNEVLRFVEGGLGDLSITRSGFKWGITLPESLNDNKHIVYVWLDALLAYITPLGYGNDHPNKMHLFSNATHFVGKDILRFHAVYWPAFLMSLKLPLPKHIYAHGWWTRDGVKMSKSIGNVINPKEVADMYGLEIVRYFLIREVPFGQDGDFSRHALIERANSELSDSLGNLLNRLLGMSEKYCNFRIQASDFDFLANEQKSVNNIIQSLESYMENMQPNRYLEELWKIFDIANVSITKYEPWEMMKNGNVNGVHSLLVFVANILAKGALMIYPMLPDTSKKMMKSLGIDFGDYDKLIAQNELLEEFTLTKIPPLFPKIETTHPANIMVVKDASSQSKDEVNIKQFDKLDIRVGKVIEAMGIKDSQNLLLLKVDFGDFGVRQIVSGIARFYNINELENMLICAIINLKPSKIKGILSEGMLLTAENSDGTLRLITPHTTPKDNIELGSKIG